MKNSIATIYNRRSRPLGTLVLILCIALILGIVFGLLCLQGWIFMLLWNWLAVSLFNASALGYWVCVGIVFTLNFLGWPIFGRTRTEQKS